jgi:hypothetical protein
MQRMISLLLRAGGGLLFEGYTLLKNKWMQSDYRQLILWVGSGDKESVKVYDSRSNFGELLKV